MFSGSVTVLVALLSAFTTAPETSRWLDDYGRALNETKRRQQPLLIVLDVPQSAGQRIEQVKHRMDKTSEELLDSYVLCHIDVTTKYGQKVADAFRAKSLPLTAIIDKTGTKIIYRTTGKFTAEKWVNALVRYSHGTVQPRPSANSFQYAFGGMSNPGICFT